MKNSIDSKTIAQFQGREGQTAGRADIESEYSRYLIHIFFTEWSALAYIDDICEATWPIHQSLISTELHTHTDTHTRRKHCEIYCFVVS